MRYLTPPLVLLLAACASTPPAQVPLEDTSIDESPYPDDEPAGVAAGEVCAIAGRRLWRLRCREAGRTTGMTYPHFCRSRWPAIDAECIARARSREELRTQCHARCLPR